MMVTNQNTPNKAILPQFCRATLMFGVLLHGELLAILLSLAAASHWQSFQLRLLVLSLFILVTSACANTLLCLTQFWLNYRGLRFEAIVAWWLIIMVTACITAITSWIFPNLPRLLFPYDSIAELVLRATAISAIVGTLLLRYLYLHRRWQQQVEIIANARFKTLQARIRPHFLFNSMNMIASLTQTNPHLAEEIVEDLADLFRAALMSDNERASLAEELELVRRYLNIECHRLGTRLWVIWDIDVLPLDAQLPPLILQPLVENAIYHGIQPSNTPGWVRISGRYQLGYVELIIDNSLPLITSSLPGHRIAADNIRQRMEVMFPKLATVIHTHSGDKYSVWLRFPYPWHD
jgi:two-component system sensor histidine kinase AlgZ